MANGLVSCATLYLLRIIRVAKYCDEYVSLCLTVHMQNRKPCGQTSPNFLCLWPVACSDGVVIRYVLPVLQMTSCCHTMGPTGMQMDGHDIV